MDSYEERIQALVDLSKWSNETMEFTSDSEDFKLITNAIGLMAYHISVEAGGRMAQDERTSSLHAVATVMPANVSACQCELNHNVYRSL